MQKGVDKERILAAFENSEIDWCQLAKEVAQRKFRSLSIILCNCHRIKGDRSGGHRTR
ncbi:recX family protein [Yersinia pestis Angola]|nr:recX family protein [Yersinia pestis Angola]